MNKTFKRILASIITVSALTTTLTGCSGNEPGPEPDVSTTSSSSSSEIPLPSIPESGGDEFSVQFLYWYDNTAEETHNNFTATEELFLDKVPIYQDSEGNKLLFSGRTPIYLKDGKIAPNDLFRKLRTAETGERLYIELDKPAAEIENDFQELLKKSNSEQTVDYRERLAEDRELKIAEDVTYDVYINNMPTGNTYRASDGVIPIYSSLNRLNLAWFKADVAEGTAKLRLFTGKGTVEVQISTGEYGVYEWRYPDIKVFGEVNGGNFRFTESNFSLSPEKIQTLLGYDIDVYDTYLNIVTDNKDLIISTNCLEIEDLMSLNDIMNVDLNKIDTTKPIKD